MRVWDVVLARLVPKPMSGEGTPTYGHGTRRGLRGPTLCLSEPRQGILHSLALATPRKIKYLESRGYRLLRVARAVAFLARTFECQAQLVAWALLLLEKGCPPDR